MKINNLRNCFSISDQIFFSQRLSLLLESNISLIESLSIMKSMEKSAKRKKVYEIFINDCDSGLSLSKSIYRIGLKFDSLLIAFIKNGEYSGSLAISLLQISKTLEKRGEIKKKIINSLIYPTFILIATIAMSLFLILYIFPKILPMLSSMHIKLPFLTILIKKIYEYSVLYGLQITLILAALFIIFTILLKKVSFMRRLFHRSLLTIPIFGLYLKISILASLCNIADLFLSSGRSLSEFHNFNAESLKNTIYINAFKDIYEDSIKGISFSNSLIKHKKLFLPLMIDMTMLGERTGNLGIMLGHCSRIFEQDLDIFFKRFSTLIEPILMIFMGIVVGSIALSIILPVYEITNNLTH